MATPDVVLRMTKTNNNNNKEPPDNQTLWQKWENHYYGREQNDRITRHSNRLSCGYFMFICVSELYVAMRYVVPWYYEEYGPSVQYWIKVFAVFVFTETMANWLCTIFMSTHLTRSEDRPDHNNKKQQTAETQYISLCVHDTEDLQPVTAAQSLANSKQAHVYGWRYCDICELQQPPRTHHCRVCRKCILKRDHHCYMTGVCVGFWNQRYFIIMNFYIAIASIWGFICIWSYYKQHVHDDWVWTDFALPWTVVRWMTGEFDFHMMLMTFHVYTLWWTGPIAVSFFVWNMFIICVGKTTREFYGNIRVKCSASMSDNFKSVFGSFWLFNFIFPAVLVFQQVGDGKHWKNVRVY